MVSKKDMPMVIGIVVVMTGAIFFMGAPFVAMNDMVGHGMNRNNPGKSFKPTYLKQDPRDAGGFLESFWPASEETFEGAAEVQANPFSE